ncbi:MAG: ABC transporter permease [Fibrobacteria bacterium]|nr:ABC transporter permease [Fibrobacteria bacterium]
MNTASLINKPTSPFTTSLKQVLSDKRVSISLLCLCFTVLFILLGPFFLPDYQLQTLENQLQAPSLRHLLGTDDLGRDILSRILKGGQLSLAVGLIATLVSIVIGTFYGCFSGLTGGKTDLYMMRIVDILYCLPYMFLVIILMTFLGKSIYVLFLALGLVQWLTVARIVRGQVLTIKHEDFILAATALGVTKTMIIFRHLLPNVAGIVIVYATLTVPSVILQESFLSFLGLNVHPCTWGVMISEGKDYMESAWWMLLFPGMSLTTCLLCLNFLGDGLRDSLDKKFVTQKQ